MDTFNPSDLTSIKQFANKLFAIDPNDVENEVITKNILKTIDIIKKLKRPQYSTSKTKELLRLLTNLTLYCQSEKVIEEIIKSNLISKFEDMISYQLENRDMEIVILDYIYGTMVNLAEFSSLVLDEYIQCNIYKCGFNLLDHIDIIGKNLLKNTATFNLYQDVFELLSSTSFHSQTSDYLIKENLVERVKQELIKLNSVDNQNDEVKFVKLYMFIIVANLSNEQELDELPVLNSMISLSIEVLWRSVNYIKTNKEETSAKMNRKYFFKYSVGCSDSLHYAVDYLSALKQISISDNNKQILYDQGILPLYDEFLVNGTEDEIGIFIDLLFSLSFNEQVIRYINETKKLKNILKKLEKESIKDETKYSCQQILKIANKSFDKRATCIQTRHNYGLIWISFCRKDRRESLIINEELKKKGYNTSLDVCTAALDSYHSTIEDIANASIVLVCYSKDYKMTSNCRLEAEYAFKLDKPVIGVKLKSNYEADGWLSKIIASKKHFDLSNDIYDTKTFTNMTKKIDTIIEKW